MKYLNKLIVFSLFMLMSFGGKIAAYTYTINNQTGQDVKVVLNPSKKGGVILADQKRRFFSSPCLKSIDVLTKEAGKWRKQKTARKVFAAGICKDRDIYLRFRRGMIYSDLR